MQTVKTVNHIGNTSVIKRKWQTAGIIMAAPAVIVIIMFIFLPLIMNIGYAFTNYNLNSIVPKFTGLTNFRNILRDPDFWLVCKNTLVLALVYVLGLNTIAIIVSVMIAKLSAGLGNAIKSVLYFPCLLAMVVVGYIWRILMNVNSGIINKTLMLLGWPADKLPEWLGDPKLIMISTGITIIWFALGYYVVIYYAGLMAISGDLYEVSTIEGANSLQEFFYVTLPMLAPSITINVVLTTMAIISSFDLPYALTNGGGPGKFGTTIPIWIYQMYFINFQYGKSLALAVFLTIIAVVVAVFELRFLLKREVQN